MPDGHVGDLYGTDFENIVEKRNGKSVDAQVYLVYTKLRIYHAKNCFPETIISIVWLPDTDGVGHRSGTR